MDELEGNTGILYSSRASVFRINPETRSSWLPIGDTAIPISFVTSIPKPDSKNINEPYRPVLKIIGNGENGDNVFEAIMLPKTTFTKRSQKFCQWVDHTGTLYGLGFVSELELTEFLDTFHQIQRNILSTPQPSPHIRSTSSINPQPRGLVGDKWNNRQHDQSKQNAVAHSETNGRFSVSSSVSSNPNIESYNAMAPAENSTRQPTQFQSGGIRGDISMNGGSNLDQDSNNNNVNTKNHDGLSYQRSQSMFGLESRVRTANRASTNTSTSNLAAGRVSPETEGSPSFQSDWSRQEQLKYENEKLKQAIEEGSKNAVIWHNELITLRTNNVKLTQALQESKANVAQWVRDLDSLKDENKKLKMRLMDIEANGELEKSNESQRDLQKYKLYLDEVQTELKRKENEVELLKRSMDEMRIQAKSTTMNDTSSSRGTIESQDRQRLDVLNAKLEAKISDLIDIQKDFASVVVKLHQ